MLDAVHLGPMEPGPAGQGPRGRPRQQPPGVCPPAQLSAARKPLTVPTPGRGQHSWPHSPFSFSAAMLVGRAGWQLSQAEAMHRAWPSLCAWAGAGRCLLWDPGTQGPSLAQLRNVHCTGHIWNQDQLPRRAQAGLPGRGVPMSPGRPRSGPLPDGCSDLGGPEPSAGLTGHISDRQD